MMGTTCQELADRLPDWASGRLDDAESALVAAHVAVCADCSAQASVLGEEALKICAAGRPNCFLCGQPINPEGHACPRANGHTILEAG